MNFPGRPLCARKVDTRQTARHDQADRSARDHALILGFKSLGSKGLFISKRHTFSKEKNIYPIEIVGDPSRTRTAQIDQ
jgi:hypothetical protein